MSRPVRDMMISSTTPQNSRIEVMSQVARDAESQLTGHPSFRRQRASKACETCHTRKVRCDAASLGVPCTNCVAFAIECKFPAPKRKRVHKSKDDGKEEQDRSASATPQSLLANSLGIGYNITHSNGDRPITPPLQLSLPPPPPPPMQPTSNRPATTDFPALMKPKFSRAPITEAGRVAYLGESSNLSLLVHDRHGTADVVHYPLPEHINGARSKFDELDEVEISILRQRGAFLLPPKKLCDELVDCYFKWVAPVVPVINRSRFMRRYRDPTNPPSLLLLQAILLAGSRVCSSPLLMDSTGSSTPAAMTFYKRAKALYDANYEDDRVTIVQALILMGWYWEGPEDVTKNVFYWSRVALVVAQGSGMHRSVEDSQLSKADKRLWKRIWWTLFTRDRSVAVALGRPVHINTEDSDVEMIVEDDFIEDEDGRPADYPPNHVHVQFFLQYVKLCEIMGLVLSQNYSVASKNRRTNAIDLNQSDMALADWLQHCPKIVFWSKEQHHFWSALLHANYYTTLCLLHRAHMPPAMGGGQGYQLQAGAYPSRDIAFQAAALITEIIRALEAHHQLHICPAFIIYSLFSALIMHVYQMRSSDQEVKQATQERMSTCMNALKAVSKVWLVAKMVHTLFESILGNKVLEERFQKAGGRNHQRSKRTSQQNSNGMRRDDRKRKFDDMDLGFANGPPAPQVSYERSRPQSPTHGNRELTQQSSVAQATPISVSHQPSSPLRQNHNDGLMDHHHPHRAGSPVMKHSYAIPATPPDIYLVTRNSPPISQSLWENFQPDQLFPEGAEVALSRFPSPIPPQPQPQPQSLDPQLQMAQPMQSVGPPIASMHNPVQTLGQPNPQDGVPSQIVTSVMQNQNAGPVAVAVAPVASVASVPTVSTVGTSAAMRPAIPTQVAQMATSVMPQAQVWQGPEQQAQPPIDPSLTGGMEAVGAQSSDDSWSNSSKGQGVIPTTLNVEDWFQFFGINGDLSGGTGIANGLQ